MADATSHCLNVTAATSFRLAEVMDLNEQLISMMVVDEGQRFKMER